MKRVFLILFAGLLCLSIPLLVVLGVKRARQPRQVFDSAAYQNRILVLDAGHGGEDGGAVSAAGDKECDINLAMVLRLEQIMGLYGVPVVLTRSDDRSIHDQDAATLREKKVSDLKNRLALVSELNNAVLLSVHQNSYTDSRYSGAQVFYASSEESKQWAEHTQGLLRSVLDESNDRSAKEIPDTVYLMNHVSCPAILVECGFMCTGAEVSLLLPHGYQTKIATALAVACVQYLRQ